MSEEYVPAKAGETREVPSSVLDTLYRSLDSARGHHPYNGAAAAFGALAIVFIIVMGISATRRGRR
jgi:hypothetical protein